MKIIYLGLYRQAEPVVELCSAMDLSHFGRFVPTDKITPLVHEFALVEARRISKTTNMHDRAPFKTFEIHSLSPRRGVVAIMIAEEKYPPTAAKTLLAKLVDDFFDEALHGQDVNTVTKVPFPRLPEILKKYENPHEADSLLKLQKELEDTKTILYKTVDAMLERGVALDQLVAKSDNLSSQSKMFYAQAKKQNSCCSVM